jgi:hypothetical protein
MNTILSNAGVKSKVTICRATQRPSVLNLGFTLDTVHYFGNTSRWHYANIFWDGVATAHDAYTWFTRQVVNYGQYVTFNTATPNALAATFQRYDSVLYATNLTKAIFNERADPALVYANVLIHEVYYFGIVGHTGDQRPIPGNFDSSVASYDKPVFISAAEAASINDYLTNGPYWKTNPPDEDPR